MKHPNLKPIQEVTAESELFISNQIYIPQIESQSHLFREETTLFAHLFHPNKETHWYITEYEGTNNNSGNYLVSTAYGYSYKEDDPFTWRFFAPSYIHLDHLKNLGFQRDLQFKPITLGNYIAQAK